MIIYVQSRGNSQEHDYRWLEVRKNSQRPSIPPLLKDLKVEELIESQKPSIVLARSGKYLLLLVTALESREERTDFTRRQIRNSVAWVSEEKPEIEQLFRAIAVRALRGELAADIDKAISIAGEYGFEVDSERLQHLVDHLEVGVKPASSAWLKYGKNHIDLRSDLALELSQFSLPHDLETQILVVVTTLKSQEALERLQVWRGLSSRIESQTWVKVSNSASNATELGSQKKTLLLGILIAILVIAIGWIIWNSTLNPSPQNSQPKSRTPSQSTSDTSLSKVPTPLQSPSTFPSIK
ncbi:MAG: hypothetical protein MUC48_19765 [Leptolyngbya sp. Prado105]|nr:hypothetical protein [Leptolyngbya sp. Prado105]